MHFPPPPVPPSAQGMSQFYMQPPVFYPPPYRCALPDSSATYGWGHDEGGHLRRMFFRSRFLVSRLSLGIAWPKCLVLRDQSTPGWRHVSRPDDVPYGC